MPQQLETLAGLRPGEERTRAERPRSCGTDWESLEPQGFYARHGRRALDLALLALSFAPVTALGLLVALANLAAFRDPRQILFVQERIGQRGRRFRIYKFRTMHAPRVSEHHSWVHGADRERVTPLGAFLRSTHLDELPQMLNILRGEMSFIGPRPEMLEIEAWASEHVEGFSRRLVLKPGITGFAQITQGYTGHSIEAYSEKLDLNEYYRARYSLALDLEILARTLVWMARGRGWQWKSHGAAWRRQAGAFRSRDRRMRRRIGEKAARLQRKFARDSRPAGPLR